MSGSTTIPVSSTPVATIDTTGIHVPTYQDVLTYLTQQYQLIYGADVYLESDSQDGQFLAIIASAIHDCNSMAAAVYSAFSPATAQGVGLSSVVKINNMRRLVATNSTVDLTLVGQAGTIINNGIAQDANNNNWLLPSSVTIPVSGQITVTAIAQNAGQISAPAGTITTILTPVRGWQTVTNASDAAPGDPVETDAALRLRQSVSTALPSQTILDGILGAIAQIPGVVDYTVYENDTATTDSNGVPPHSVSFVVEGGDATQIATAIALKKTPGAGTYGTTSVTITDPQGLQKTINFFRPTQVPINVAMTIQPLNGYTTVYGSQVTTALVNAINALPIGQDVYRTMLYGAAYGAVPGTTFNITNLQIGTTGTPASQDIAIAFNQVAVCTTNNITLTVLVNG